jgi:predicted transcriptional regulator
MIYIENSKQLRDFISFFTTRHIPIIVEWLENEHNIKLPYEVLIWGDFRLLHRSLQKGIYGNLYVE